MEFKKDKSLGSLFSNSFKALKYTWKELLKLYAINLGIIVAFMVVVGITAFIPPLTVILVLICIFPLILVEIAFTGAGIYILYRAYLGEVISWSDGFKAAWNKKWSLIGANLLISLILLIPMLLFGGLIFGSIMVSVYSNEMAIFGTIILTLIFILVIFIASIGMGLLFAFCDYGIICKDLNAIDGLKYTFKLYKGQFAEVLARLLLIQLIVGTATGVVTFPISFVGELASNGYMFTDYYFTPGMEIVMGIGSIFVSIVVTIVSLIATAYQQSALVGIVVNYDKDINSIYNPVIVKEEVSEVVEIDLDKEDIVEENQENLEVELNKVDNEEIEKNNENNLE